MFVLDSVNTLILCPLDIKGVPAFYPGNDVFSWALHLGCYSSVVTKVSENLTENQDEILSRDVYPWGYLRTLSILTASIDRKFCTQNIVVICVELSFMAAFDLKSVVKHWPKIQKLFLHFLVCEPWKFVEKRDEFREQACPEDKIHDRKVGLGALNTLLFSKRRDWLRKNIQEGLFILKTQLLRKNSIFILFFSASSTIHVFGSSLSMSCRDICLCVSKTSSSCFALSCTKDCKKSLQQESLIWIFSHRKQGLSHAVSVSPTFL